MRITAFRALSVAALSCLILFVAGTPDATAKNCDRFASPGNVIDDNGEGVVFGASGLQSSSHNRLQANIIVNSRVLYNVAGAYRPTDRVGRKRGA